MLQKTTSELESRKERRGNCSSTPAVMHGMTEGFDPHMLDVTSMVEDSWAQVSKETTARC